MKTEEQIRKKERELTEHLTKRGIGDRERTENIVNALRWVLEVY